MRSELGKECRKLFRKMMAMEFPEYQEDKGQIVPQGVYVWTRRSSGLWLHIFLLLDPTRDKFTVEGGWSKDGKKKSYSIWHLEELMSEPNNIRLAHLWHKSDFWWGLFPDLERPRSIRERLIDDPIEQCLPMVPPAVSDAAKKLKEHLIPVFGKIVEKHGNGPKSKEGSQQPQEQS